MDDHSKSQIARLRTQSEMYGLGYKAGYEAGLRRASEIADATEAEFLRESTLPDLTGTYSKHCAACASGAGSVEVAILAEIKGE